MTKPRRTIEDFHRDVREMHGIPEGEDIPAFLRRKNTPETRARVAALVRAEEAHARGTSVAITRVPDVKARVPDDVDVKNMVRVPDVKADMRNLVGARAGLISVNEIAVEMNVAPGRLRAMLRSANVPKPEWGWAWTPEEAETIKQQILKEKDDGDDKRTKRTARSAGNVPTARPMEGVAGEPGRKDRQSTRSRRGSRAKRKQRADRKGVGRKAADRKGVGRKAGG